MNTTNLHPEANLTLKFVIVAFRTLKLIVLSTYITQHKGATSLCHDFWNNYSLLMMGHLCNINNTQHEHYSLCKGEQTCGLDPRLCYWKLIAKKIILLVWHQLGASTQTPIQLCMELVYKGEGHLRQICLIQMIPLMDTYFRMASK